MGVVAVSKDMAADSVRGRDVGDLREDEFKVADMAVNALIRFRELRTEYQYPKEIASSIIAHN